MNIYMTALGLNAFDLLTAIVIASFIYFGKKDGIVAECVKLLGIYCSVFITLHYYSRLAGFLKKEFFGKNADTEIFSFFLLAILSLLSFVVIAKGWSLIIKIKSAPIVDRWGHLIVASVRSYFFCSLILLAAALMQHSYLTPMAHRSVSSILFQNAAVDFYKSAHSVLIDGYFPGEVINKDVFKLVRESPDHD